MSYMYMLTYNNFPTADAHSVSSRLRSELPGRGKEAEKEAEKYGAQAGAKFDNAVSPPIAYTCCIYMPSHIPSSYVVPYIPMQS